MTEKQKEYYQKNRERILARQKQYNLAHKEEKAAYDRKRAMERWREKSEYNEQYYQEHRERISEYYKKRRKEGRKPMDINAWKQERDAVVKTYDIERFKKFYEKWTKKGFYNLELPPDSVLEVSLRYMVLNMDSATEQEKEEARWWLARRGIKA